MMHRSAGGFAACFVGIGIFAAAATARAGAVEHGSARIRGGEQAAAVTADVDAIFAPWDSAASPGCALGVVRDGELVYERGYGSANLDWRLPIATDTVFYVGSVSKQFTAASIAMANCPVCRRV